MSLGSYILYLRGIKEGITPREVAQEIDMPEHYIHAIELEKHGGDVTSRTKLAEYFDIPVDEFSECSRSTHARFMELLKKERRPQVGFVLMNGETLFGTVDGADSSIVKIVELNSGVKTILQRHAIKRWWPLKKSSSDRPGGGRPMGGGRPGGGRPPFNGGGGGGGRPPFNGGGGGGGRPPFNGGGGGGRPPFSGGGGGRPPFNGGGGGSRPPFNGGGGGGRPPMGGGMRYDRPEPGNERENPPRGRNSFME